MLPADAAIPFHDEPLAIHVDARADEDAWAHALELSGFVVFRPVPGRPPAAATRVRVLADHRALYVFFEATDDHPERLRAGLARRDRPFSDDWVGVYLDPAGEGQRAYVFLVSARGVQIDGVRAAGANGDDTSWDGLWSAEARRTEDGYAVEMAIPWRTVRHPAHADRLGLLFARHQPRAGEVSTVPPVDPDVQGMLPQLGRYRLDADLPRRAGVDLIPELTFAWSDEGAVQERWGAMGLSPGLTVRAAPSPSLSALLALNPDFSQVESDAARIEVNRRYALYYEEKRPFFLEGQEWFETPLGDLVYTRSMVAPEAGLRATVEGGGWTAAALSVLDAAPSASVSEGGGWTEEDLEGRSGEESVLRLRRALGEDAFVGLLLSDRTVLGADLANRVAAADGRVRLSEAVSLAGGAAGSWTRSADGTDRSDVAGALEVERAGRRVTGGVRGTWIGPDFRAENGFVTLADYAGAEWWLDFDAYPDGAVVRKLEFSPVDGEAGWTTDGRPRLRELSPNAWAAFAGDYRAGLGLDLGGEDFLGTWLPSRQVWGWSRLGIARWLTVRGGGSVGRAPYYAADPPGTGWEASGRGSVTFEPVAAVALTALAGFEDFRESAGGAGVYRAAVGRLKLETFATRALWARWIVDWSRTDDLVGGGTEEELRYEALLAWEHGPGRALWLGGHLVPGDGGPTWQVFAKASWVLAL